jgi:hypothetical protein
LDATTDPEQIRKWFDGKAANIGIRTGKESGLLVLDVDGEDARKTIKSLSDKLGPLPRTLTAKTGRADGGWHLLFNHPGVEVPSTNKTQKSGIPGNDIRCDGGYIVAPPSIHISGNHYRFLAPPDGVPKLADLPKSWLELIRKRCYTECTESAECTECTGILLNTPEITVTGPLETRGPMTDVSESIKEAIQATIPSEPGHRHGLIFSFVRRLKALDDLRDLAADDLRQYAKAWHKAALPTIGTKDFDVTWQDFQFAWDECLHAWGEDPMGQFFQDALSEEPPAKAASLYGPKSLRTRLATLCRALQRRAGEEPFFLSSRQAATALGVSPMHASRWLNRLTTDGIVETVTKGRLTGHQASEYLYVGDRS